MSLPTASPHTRSRLAPKKTTALPKLEVARVREDFPILKQTVHGNPLVYLDNAATTQKPQVVLDTLTRYYTTMNANVHRGVHQLSERATQEYEGARVKVQRFIGAAEAREIYRALANSVRGEGRDVARHSHQ